MRRSFPFWILFAPVTLPNCTVVSQTDETSGDRSGSDDSGLSRSEDGGDSGQSDGGPNDNEHGSNDGGSQSDGDGGRDAAHSDGGDLCAERDCSELDTVCAIGRCDESTGKCVSAPFPDGTVCDDADACTEADLCEQGACAGRALDCDDENECTTDTCAEGSCSHDPIPNDSPCDDADACSQEDSCQGGQCGGTFFTCDDGDACTDDSCDAIDGCRFSPNTGNVCDDQSVCTENDTCRAGACEGQPIVCDDGEACTVADCNSGTGCFFTLDVSVCSEGEACSSGVLVCEDQSACTDDSCDAEQGCRFSPNDANPCTDDNVCTLGDSCSNGVCVTSGALDCDDSQECTNDSCDSESGCENQPKVGAACDIADRCTIGACNDLGNCETAPVICDDKNPCTDDSCDSTEGCVFTANDGNACTDDDNACTPNHACVDGTCVGSGSLNCDDLDTCTLDRCEPDVGCRNTIKNDVECICPSDAVFDNPVENPGQPEFLQGNNGFLEGPVWVPSQGVLYYTNFSGSGSNGRIRSYDPVLDAHGIFIEGIGVNGLAIDQENQLVAGFHEQQRVLRINPLSGERSSVPGGSSYLDKPFNSVNDVIVRSDGNIYFTDPTYQRGGRPGQDLRGFYHLTPGGVLTLIGSQDQPNGIALSPDGLWLYIAGTGRPRELLRYPIEADGRVTAESSTISTRGSDGMAVDCLGNLYLTTGGSSGGRVTVLDRDGVLLGEITGFSGGTTNAAFGGDDSRTLFVTTSNSLWQVRLELPGLP